MTRRTSTLSMLAGLLLAVTATAFGAPPEIPATPAPVLDILVARPVQLTKPYRHTWTAEPTLVRSGYLLVLKVDPALVYPRQTEEPVLYVGNQTAERLNVGYRSGHVVAFVPAELDPAHAEAVDLRTTPIWFGAPAFPERIDIAAIAEERARAKAAGITPLPRARIEAALRAGGATLAAAGKHEMLHAAGSLVLRHAPAEAERAQILLSAGDAG
ncbi:MAG: hypothetical protein HKO59_09220 [Phycisphaerales bacterium]|nr:hypothetical protein [Phycisphaerae bacterium]NNM26149.1 hypothetical protein [Phycisphaerales bacterium]